MILLIDNIIFNIYKEIILLICDNLVKYIFYFFNQIKKLKQNKYDVIMW